MKILDLSVDLAHHMVRYPSPYLPNVTIIPAATHEKEARSAQIVTFGTHVSTHIDAPFHAIPGGQTIDQLPLDQLMGPAKMLRFGDRDASSPLDAKDFQNLKSIEKYKKLVLDTGWAKRTWGSKSYFTEGPFLTRDAAKFLAQLPNLHLIGMDFPNIDAKSETVMGTPAPNHQIILGKKIILLENLLNLDQVDDLFLLIATPPKLVGGDGCPCRASAVFPLNQLSSWALVE